jgi:predicted nucleic-acid-binding protein
MIGLDTNILLRLVLQDHPVEGPKATKFFKSLSSDEPGFVNTVVLAEFVWTLRSRVGLARGEIADTVSGLLDSGDIVFEHEDLVEYVLDRSRTSKADVADLLIALKNEAAGCLRTVSFDKDACKTIPSMELLA